MFNKSCRSSRSHSRHGYSHTSITGNSAFDTYKADTLRRLEEEQTNFEDFLRRLRESKDKAEFDEFMNDRAKKAADPEPREDATA